MNKTIEDISAEKPRSQSCLLPRKVYTASVSDPIRFAHTLPNTKCCPKYYPKYYPIPDRPTNNMDKVGEFDENITPIPTLPKEGDDSSWLQFDLEDEPGLDITGGEFMNTEHP